MNPNEKRCEDCGRIVSKYRGRWADRESRGRQYQQAYNFTCRVETYENPNGGVTLMSADYHYVAGETQKHWELPDDPH